MEGKSKTECQPQGCHSPDKSLRLDRSILLAWFRNVYSVLRQRKTTSLVYLIYWKKNKAGLADFNEPIPMTKCKRSHFTRALKQLVLPRIQAARPSSKRVFLLDPYLPMAFRAGRRVRWHFHSILYVIIVLRESAHFGDGRQVENADGTESKPGPTKHCHQLAKLVQLPLSAKDRQPSDLHKLQN
uniref:Uncharacterized protein n=1 Tax=Coccidioides posadasii RMSCC 3488 TaxID=454284 RepID=A0A0J6FV72_COCPO|nr:hypothetical protein CPAG_09343 [Coccidioides posadasii RMSCC 3488]